MFTGIITHSGIVKKIEFGAKKDCLLAISIKEKIARKLDIGCSIACNGICLTLIKKTGNTVFFEASEETCAKTSLKKWQVGDAINIEFSLRMGDELGGHLVSGHVDGCAKLKASKRVKGSVEMVFALEKNSQDLQKFIAAKGSIVLNGVSLTVNKVGNLNKLSNFEVTTNIIPHTLEKTNLGSLEIGDLVNVEIDLIARYLARFLKK